MATSQDDINEANRRGSEIANAPTVLVAASVSNGVLRLTYRNGMMFRIAIASVAELNGATKKQLQEIVISRTGDSIAFPQLDRAIYVPGLIAKRFSEDA